VPLADDLLLQTKKSELCNQDLDYAKFALDLVQITQEKQKYPKILCFVNTISVHHYTRAMAVKETWGQRCDKLIFFSNVTDEVLGSIKIDVIADHNHLWQKHKASLRYVWEHYRHDYDWFYKADDDAYVIMENLRAYLRQPEILMQKDIKPMQMGHRYSLTQDLIDYYVVDKKLREEYRKNWNHWVFNSGGPGYVMNKLYMETAIASLHKWNCLSDKYSEMLPDDASISFCMSWHNIYPLNTRDLKGRERWHADKPRGVYFTNPDQPNYWVVQYHNGIGGLQWKEECCSPESIAFHYILPPLMYHLERQLYYCRSTALDLPSFNAISHLNITSRILIVEQLPETTRP